MHSQFVFANMLNLACHYNISIYWFYRHGCGLTDAMAWFGCKGPLRKAIIQQDKCFPTASTLVDFLQQNFKDHSTKEFCHIDLKENAKRRSQHVPDEFFILKGLFLLISYHSIQMEL